MLNSKSPPNLQLFLGKNLHRHPSKSASQHVISRTRISSGYHGFGSPGDSLRFASINSDLIHIPEPTDPRSSIRKEQKMKQAREREVPPRVMRTIIPDVKSHQEQEITQVRERKIHRAMETIILDTKNHPEQNTAQPGE
ncbi:hypothetical protein DSL72_002629 [Monilinia vaccinii-corymbosi]|uniref:Uncharacterized protein n=1 Tax=Monilinia vaccinii-corymbosi TaxID=61207 RepID=A0A8A3PD75_9HELO|nr:hypothetical protein DSL72_002629 [Monilinia vaccinii-corymbosi]